MTLLGAISLFLPDGENVAESTLTSYEEQMVDVYNMDPFIGLNRRFVLIGYRATAF